MLAAAPSSAAGSPTVAAILSPGERSRVDAAGTGCFAILHRESISDAIRMVRERPVDAVLLSVQQCGPEQVDGVAHLVREFPSVPTVALVSQYGPRATETLLLLGASGVKRVIDVTAPTGWAHLRELLTQPVTRSVARIQGPVLCRPQGRDARYPALPRGDDPPRSRHAHGAQPRQAPRRSAQHPHVPVRPRRPAQSQELPRRRSGCCMRRSCSRTRAFRSPTWPTASNTRRPSPSAGTSGRCSASPQPSSGIAFRFRWQWNDL